MFTRVLAENFSADVEKQLNQRQPGEFLFSKSSRCDNLISLLQELFVQQKCFEIIPRETREESKNQNILSEKSR